MCIYKIFRMDIYKALGAFMSLQVWRIDESCMHFNLRSLPLSLMELAPMAI